MEAHPVRAERVARLNKARFIFMARVYTTNVNAL
jgi:hypothetical protein